MRRTRAFAAWGLVALVTGCGGSGGRPHDAAAMHGSGPRPLAPVLGSLGSSGAGHRFYEIYEPAGPPRGTVLVIHGGGWLDQRGDARRMMTVASLAFQAHGWRAIDIGYSPGEHQDPLPMLRDVVAFYDEARLAFGGPICAYGESAGGNLAAMLAVERPSLTCAILNAAPLDLPPLLASKVPAVVSDLARTFGTGHTALQAFSPALVWNPKIDRTAIFATAAADDAVVPADQLTAFKAADPSADAQVVPGARAGSQDALPWMHSAVDAGAITARLTEFWSWLDRIAPHGRASTVPASTGTSTGTGADCGAPRAGAQRFELMLAGEAWQQSATPGQPIAATRGCSGSADHQDDGLSLWALPSTNTLPQGATAQLVLDSGHVMRRLTASFRGFLARPRDWRLGLYASTSTNSPTTVPVATCNRGKCTGLGLFTTSFGSLVTVSGSTDDPDNSSQPPSATFTLPAGTRRIVWQLACVAPGGCSLQGIGNARPRDPLGQPAIFSLYRAQVS